MVRHRKPPSHTWRTFLENHVKTMVSVDFLEGTEDLDTKQEVFDAFEAVVDPAVPIASNTSALPISMLQQSRRHPGRFVGMHWAEPALERAAELTRRLDKDPCLVQRDVPGFIVNRLGYTMYREAVHLLETGVADVETIDRSFRNACGLWASLCGPFRWGHARHAAHAEQLAGAAADARKSAGVLHEQAWSLFKKRP
jgi:hypothetical protein